MNQNDPTNPNLPGFRDRKLNPVLESYKEDITNMVRNQNYTIGDAKMSQVQNNNFGPTSINLKESEREMQKQKIMEDYKRDLKEQIQSKNTNGVNSLRSNSQSSHNLNLNQDVNKSSFINPNSNSNPINS